MKENIEIRTDREIEVIEENSKKIRKLPWPKKGIFAMQISRYSWEKISFKELESIGGTKPDGYIATYKSHRELNIPNGNVKRDMFLVLTKDNLFHIAINDYMYNNGKTEKSVYETEGYDVFNAMRINVKL